MRTLVRFAVADARGSRAKLLAFALLLALGLSMLVAIRGTVASIRLELATTARDMLGGDVVVFAREQISSEAWSGESADVAAEVRIRTMVQGPSGAQLAQVRGVTANYPLRGAIHIEPSDASWRDVPGAVAERSLLDRLGVVVGDEIELFGKKILIKAELVSAPGDFAFGSLIAPRLYLPKEWIPNALLEQRGSLVDYLTLFRLPNSANPESFSGLLRERLDQARFTVSTAEQRAERMSSTVSSVGALAATVAVAATLLGLMGTAIAIHFYLRERRIVTALLKCIGASRAFVRAAYLAQLGILALTSGAAGIVCGTAIHLVLLGIASRVMETRLQFGIDLRIVADTLALILAIVIWAAWPALTALVAMPALSAIRSDVEPMPRTRLSKLLHLGSGLGLLGILWLLTGSERAAGILLAGLVVGGGFLVLGAIGARRVFRVLSEHTTSVELRLALRNLTRPGNQTIPMLAALTLALGLTVTLTIVTDTLEQVRGVTIDGGHSNLFIYELNPEQAEDASAIIKRNGGTFIQKLPVVLMRIRSIKGALVSEIVRSKPYGDRWSFTREYWTSYRPALQENESILSGAWISEIPTGTDIAPISLDSELAERLGVVVGDEIEWEVQGVVLRSTVASLRAIMWERLERNSFVVFPRGVLEDAPQFLFWSLDVPTAEQRGVVTREITGRFPNASVVDLTVVVDQVLTLLEKVGWALRALLILVILVAISLLLVVALGARAERSSELQLLVRLGMRRARTRWMIGYEFAVLGGVASVFGGVLGTALGIGVARFGFHQAPGLPLGTIVGLCCSLLLVTVCVSMVVSGASAGNRTVRSR